MAARSLSPETLAALLAPLAAPPRVAAGSAPARQPVHTVYGGAQLFRADVAKKFGLLAGRVLDEHAPSAFALAEALGLPGSDRLPPHGAERAALTQLFERSPAGVRAIHREAFLALTVHRKLREKLAREPVEDFRIDFEDGYGPRASDEEDGHAEAVGRELARGLAGGLLPPSVGIRIKALDEQRARSLRTLDLVVTTLAAESRGALPAGFVVTLPKITAPEQVGVLVAACEALEGASGLAAGSLRIELMIETARSLVSPAGELAVPALLERGRGRVAALHFGAYDYTADLGVAAHAQRAGHPACDLARQLMQLSSAGRGVALSDGATNVLPVPPRRAAEGASLGLAEQDENRASVRAALRLHYDNVRASLAAGFYQGWDLHPAQLPARYAAVYSFFHEGLDESANRLARFLDQAARATLSGAVFDDAATGQGLLNFFLRALNAGALDEAEVLERTSLSPEELRTRSFGAILARRSGGAAEPGVSS